MDECVAIAQMLAWRSVSRVKREVLSVAAVDRYGFLDLTDELRRAVKDAGLTEGMVVAFRAHTTCALLINEWEEGALVDFRRHLTDSVPHEGVYYQHDDFEIRIQNMHEDERKNRHAHVKAMLLSATSHAIPITVGEPAFGTWQRLTLFGWTSRRTARSRSTSSGCNTEVER